MSWLDFNLTLSRGKGRLAELLSLLRLGQINQEQLQELQARLKRNQRKDTTDRRDLIVPKGQKLKSRRLPAFAGAARGDKATYAWLLWMNYAKIFDVPSGGENEVSFRVYSGDGTTYEEVTGWMDQIYMEPPNQPWSRTITGRDFIVDGCGFREGSGPNNDPQSFSSPPPGDSGSGIYASDEVDYFRINPAFLALPVDEVTMIVVVYYLESIFRRKAGIQTSSISWWERTATPCSGLGQCEYQEFFRKTSAVTADDYEERKYANFASFVVSKTDVRQIDTPESLKSYIKTATGHENVSLEPYAGSPYDTCNGSGESEWFSIDGLVSNDEDANIDPIGYGFQSYGFNAAFVGISGVNWAWFVNKYSIAIYEQLRQGADHWRSENKIGAGPPFYPDQDYVAQYMAGIWVPAESVAPCGETGDCTISTTSATLDLWTDNVQEYDDIAGGTVVHDDNGVYATQIDADFFNDVVRDSASSVNLLTAWDGDRPEYCRQQLLAIGFSSDDLRP